MHKLLPNIVFDEKFFKLFEEVRRYRKISKQCQSAQDGQKLNELLTEIVNQNIYEKDYEEITSKLLYEDINYDTVINSLKKIIKELSNL